MDNNNACKYFIGLDAKVEHCNNFDQSISKLLNNDNIADRIKFRKNLILKIRGLHDMIIAIVHRFDGNSKDKDRYEIKSMMDDTAGQFRNIFILNGNEVMNEDSIAECVATLKQSIYLTNKCVKNYIITPIILLTEKIDNNEKTQETVIKICEIKFNSFNSFVKNYEDAFDLIGKLKEKYMKQSKKNQ